MSRDYEGELVKADNDHTEWLEGLTEAEVQARHFLLDKKGVAGVLHWFDFAHEEPYNDLSGRLDPERGVFYYMDSEGQYRMLWPAAVKRSSNVAQVLFGTKGRVLGEIRLVQEES